jgi:hypothetical protein
MSIAPSNALRSRREAGQLHGQLDHAKKSEQNEGNWHGFADSSSERPTQTIRWAVSAFLGAANDVDPATAGATSDA